MESESGFSFAIASQPFKKEEEKNGIKKSALLSKMLRKV